MGRHLITIHEAAALSKVSRRTIYNWLYQGRLDYVRTAGGGIRIYESSLWRDENGQPFGGAQPQVVAAPAVGFVPGRSVRDLLPLPERKRA